MGVSRFVAWVFSDAAAAIGAGAGAGLGAGAATGADGRLGASAAGAE